MMRISKPIIRFATGSILRQLTLGVALVHAVLMTIFVFDLVSRQNDFLRAERLNLTSELSRMLATGAGSRVLARDFAGLAEEMDALKAHPGVRYGMIVDTTGRVLAHTDIANINGIIGDPVSRRLLDAAPAVQSLVNTEALIDTAAPILTSGRLVGWARIGMNGSDITQTLGSVAAKGVAYTLAAIGVGIMLALLLAKGLTRGLRNLNDVANKARAGDRTVRASTRRIDEIGSLGASVNAMLDNISESERALRIANEKLGAVINASPVAIVSIDPQLNIVTWNRAAEGMFGYSSDDIEGMSYRVLVPEDQMEALDAAIARVASGEILQNVESRRHHKDGSIVDVSTSAAPVYESDLFAGMVVAIEDITEKRKTAAHITHLATHDTLTGLPNRDSFHERLQDALERADQRGRHLAVFRVCVGGIDGIEQELGSSAADALLRAVADRLRDRIEREMKVARIGGGEFAILKEAQDYDEIRAFARQTVKDVEAIFVIGGQEVSVGGCIGIAVGPDDGDDADILLKRASVALNRAKLDGPSSRRFFEAGMDAQFQSRRTLEKDLRHALENGELEVHYQPFFNLQDRRATGCEALLRWRHPELGMISPSLFIPIAEETNLIVPIGNWVLATACADAMTWPGKLKVAVNLSTVQFRSVKLLQSVLSALANSGLPASRLELEVTESLLMQDDTDSLTMLRDLRELGVRIAMDDFGTGYSSLSYIQRFPFDKIKIDQSFIRDLPDSAECMAIVRAVVGLSDSLKLTTTAEGIETEEQLQTLREAGCTEGQGYLISRPLPIAEIRNFLDRHRAAA